MTRLIIQLLHLYDTHLNSYSVPSWYSGNRPWAALDPTFGNPPLFVAALVNKLVPCCAWLLSSALEIMRFDYDRRSLVYKDIAYDDNERLYIIICMADVLGKIVVNKCYDSNFFKYT